MAYARELEAVLSWVEETDRIALAHFRSGAAPEIKSDGTPVTAGDRAVEERLREAIAAEFPGDAIVGEEQGATGQAPRRWIIDPIDGTKNFARGIPVFATLIALEEEGSARLGMVSAPALGTRWWAAAGAGAFRNGEAIGVSATARIEDADVCTGGIDWARDGDALVRMLARARRHRGFGDFWGAMLVAEGSMDVMIEYAPLKVWDYAATVSIVAEAGGRITDGDGSSALGAPPFVWSNGALHEPVLAALRS